HVYGKLKTFSIGFKESKFDESRYASQVAEHLKTEHTEYMLSEKEAVGILETYLHHFDEPFADTSAIPTMLVSKLARKEVTVALTGDGGDELFQGYGAYTWANRLDTLRWKILKTPLEKILKASNNSRWLRISRLLENVPPHELRSHIFSQEQYFFTQSEIRDKLLISKDQIKPFLYDDSYPKDKALMAAERQAIFDLQYYLKDDLLVKVDRASMFHALECRCPLLDHHV
ncbi:MAG: asparagine synthase-related protein, partial [Bacteroidota bacterium]